MSQTHDVADQNTREFLIRVVDILLDYIKDSNDRNKKIVDFHHPDQLKEVIDLEIPEKPLNLDQLLVDCKDTLKYQVKTGKSKLLRSNDFLFYWFCVCSKCTKRFAQKENHLFATVIFFLFAYYVQHFVKKPILCWKEFEMEKGKLWEKLGKLQ